MDVRTGLMRGRALKALSEGVPLEDAILMSARSRGASPPARPAAVALSQPRPMVARPLPTAYAEPKAAQRGRVLRALADGYSPEDAILMSGR